MNSIKNSTKFNNLVKELQVDYFVEKLKEITTTASIDTYQTPYAFSKKRNEEEEKKNIEKQLDISLLMKPLSKDDINKIKKEIRKEVSDILFDIWVKRSSWEANKCIKLILTIIIK